MKDSISDCALSPIEQLLGTTLYTGAYGDTNDTARLLQDKDLVLLYFSASWCPPCQKFTPLLVQFYNHVAVASEQQRLEIVFVSSDRSMSEFQAYYHKMPWLAIPPPSARTGSQLSSYLTVYTIPTLILLDAKTGHFVTNQARHQIVRAATSAEKARQLVEDWKAIPPIPIQEAGLNGFTVCGTIRMIVKHPVFIIVLVLLVLSSIFHGS